MDFRDRSTRDAVTAIAQLLAIAYQRYRRAQRIGAERSEVPHQSMRDSCITSPRHERKYTPAQVWTGVGGVAYRRRAQFGSNLVREIIVGIRIEPSAHREPLRGLVSVPAVLICQNHFHNIVTKVAKRCEEFCKQEKV